MQTFRQLINERHQVMIRIKSLNTDSQEYQFNHYRIRELDKQIKEFESAIRISTSPIGNYGTL